MPTPSTSADFPESDSNFSFNSGRSPPLSRPRPKPRLFKQRRSSKPSPPPTFNGPANPFNPSLYTDVPNSNNNNNVVIGGPGFVFGVSNPNNTNNNGSCNLAGGGGGDSSCNDSNTKKVYGGPGFVFGVSSKKGDENGSCNLAGCTTSREVGNGSLDSEENKGNGPNSIWPEGFGVEGKVFGCGDGSLGKEGCSFRENNNENGPNSIRGEIFGCGVHVGDQGGVNSVRDGEGSRERIRLAEELGRLDIESEGKDGFSGEKVEGEANGGDGYFVFKSGGLGGDVANGSSVPVQGDVDNGTSAKGNGGGVDDGESCDNVFVFGSSGIADRGGGSSPKLSRVEEEVLRFSFSSTRVGADIGSEKPKEKECSVSGEGKPEFCAPSTPEGFGSEFKLPDFDAPLSFSVNLPSEVGRKPELKMRTRGLREKHSKKVKGKTKQSKSGRQESVEKPISDESVAQNQEAAAECYSPMDFSPDQETTDNDVPHHQSTVQPGEEDGSTSGVYTESQPNVVFMSNGVGATSSDCSTGVSSNANSHDGSGPQFDFASNVGENKFTFTASCIYQDPVRPKKKYRMKTASVSGRTPVSQGPSVGVPPVFSKVKDQSESFSASASASKGSQENRRDKEQGREPLFALSAAEKACDKWRKRGNEAYERGELSKAEDYYTWGVNCVPLVDVSGVVFTPLVRCYSNRAATRMALGRMREAVQDCLMAVKLDPNFHRAHMRAANCYLQLGELEDAVRCFESCMEASNAVCLDRQVIISASEGIQKSQKVIECINRSAELLELRTSEAAASALESIAEAMSISMHAEKLLEMKAEALCMLRRHEEAITLCQQTLDFAEKNFTTAAPRLHQVEGSFLNVHLWRHRISSKCHFHLGKLEAALDLIEIQELGGELQELSDPLAITIRELLSHKSAGNTAFQAGNHAEAIEHYTSAILSSLESPPFAAICFCNRAAAHQALGQITDAISDCSLAVALDENYAKAVSRRATLHEMIRDYRQAAADLQRLVSLLETQAMENSKHSGSGNGKELSQVQRRLSVMEEEAKKDVPLDLYLILGIKKSDPAAEVKKAYRKAALRHHPDKACQSLVRNDVGDEGRLRKDIAELVQKDSDRLFKMIGEAYAVLSDPAKREEYDDEEDMRKAIKERNNVRSTSRRYSEYYQGYPFERSSNRRHWQDGYRYSYSDKRW